MNTAGEKETVNWKEGEMSQTETSERMNGDTPLSYSGLSVLMGEQCNEFDQRVASQKLCEHGPT
jgi:hypothetical protein